MAFYDLYGFTGNDIFIARSALEALLGVHFEERESDYHGGIYFLSGKSNGEHYVLKRNIDLVDNEPSESGFQNYTILLYINDTDRSEPIEKQICSKSSDFVLLRRENFQ